MNRGPVTTSALLEAEQIINVGRADHNYGHPIEDMERTAQIATLIMGKPISPQDICKIMFAVKLSREVYTHKRDNMVDLCGYAEILQQIEDHYAQKDDRA